MKAQRVIQHRDQSRPATCERIVGNWLIGQYCGEPLRLIVTNSPLRGFMQLVVERCPLHVGTAHGVVEE